MNIVDELVGQGVLECGEVPVDGGSSHQLGVLGGQQGEEEQADHGPALVRLQRRGPTATQ